ncbi:MAG: flagellar biosynthesis protein FlhF [Thermoleophilaceae bacterium]
MNANGQTKTYRGRTLEEVLPRIKAELGPHAVITRQRDGLTGGVGGFFQHACIEVEARAGMRRFDAYDDSTEMTAPQQQMPGRDATTEGLSSPVIQAMLDQAAPFADHLSIAERSEPPEHLAGQPTEPHAFPDPPPTEFVELEPEPEVAIPSAAHSQASDAGARARQADQIEAALVAAGIDPALSATLVRDTVSHLLPFASPRSLKRLVRAALARRIPVEPGAFGPRRSLAFVGPGGSGKTLCAARLAAAYASGSDLPVLCLALRPASGGAELAQLLEPLGVAVHTVSSAAGARAHVEEVPDRALIVLDTPAVAAKSEAEVAELADEVAAIGLDEVHLTLPSTFSGPAAQELVERLVPLRPSHIALTHTDESSHIGGIVDMVIKGSRPVSYISEGTSLPGGLQPADADALATLVLP